jgi:hypothetical protein
LVTVHGIIFLIFPIPPPPLVPRLCLGMHTRRLCLLYKKVGKLRAPGFITESIGTGKGHFFQIRGRAWEREARDMSGNENLLREQLQKIKP